MPRLRFAAIAVLALTASACSTAPQPSLSSGHGGDGGATPSPTSVLDLSHATAGRTSSTDVTAPLHPQIYTDPGDPCAGIGANEPVAAAPAACGIPFIDLGAGIVPGTEVIDVYHGPAQVRAQEGISATTASAVGNAFEVADALRLWAIGSNVPAVIPELDAAGTATDDALYHVLLKNKVNIVTLPACVFPTSLRVVPANSDVQGYMEHLNWPQPSQTAVVATYDTCPGMTLTLSSGTTTTVLAHPQTVSIVATGKVIDVSPFGPLFVQDGWAPCGAAELSSVC